MTATIIILTIHVVMSALCTWRKAAKEAEIGRYDGPDWGLFIGCLFGMWFIVPEAWDNSRMDKYKN